MLSLLVYWTLVMKEVMAWPTSLVAFFALILYIVFVYFPTSSELILGAWTVPE